MTKFEKILLLLSAVFLLGLGAVTYRAAQPLPLRVERATPAAASGHPLDINTATAEELCSLPGVGAVTAERIVAWREGHGPFASLEDLLQVEGIGEKTLEKIYEYMEENRPCHTSTPYSRP